MEKRKYITPDIIEVKAIDNYKIYLKFDTKEEKIFDMEKLVNEIKFYKKLKNIDYFKKVKVRGETVEWPEGEDVSPESLYYESKAIK